MLYSDCGQTLRFRGLPGDIKKTPEPRRSSEVKKSTMPADKVEYNAKI